MKLGDADVGMGEEDELGVGGLLVVAVSVGEAVESGGIEGG